MDVLIPLGIFCLVPILIFGAGWVSCYYLMVKYRLRVDRREEFDLPIKAGDPRRGSSKAVWEP